MAKWINPNILALNGIQAFSQMTGVVLLSAETSLFAAAQTAGSVFIMSIVTSVTSNLVHYSIGISDLTVSIATTSAYSALADGTATYVGIITSGTTLAYVTSCTSQGISTAVPYYTNPMVITISTVPT